MSIPAAAGSPPPRKSSAGSPNLDLLRALAVGFVVVSHVPGLRTDALDHYYHFGAIGLLGVIIFFVHTCLVLMMSLERQTASLGPSRRATAFFIRRAFRIYPLSIVIVLVTHAVMYARAATPPDPWLTVTNLLLVQNLFDFPSNPGPLWSLPFEVQMYLVLPALFVLVRSRRRDAPLVLLALWAASIATVLGLWKAGANYHLIKYIPCFLPGVLAYSLLDRRRSLPSFALFAYVGALLIGYPLAVAHGVKEHVAAWPICLMLGLLIPRCREIENATIQRAAKTVAKYSYGIYLVHAPCFDVAFGAYTAALPSAARWALWALGTSSLSWLAYRFIEQPAINFGVRLAERFQRTGQDRAALGALKTDATR